MCHSVLQFFLAKYVDSFSLSLSLSAALFHRPLLLPSSWFSSSERTWFSIQCAWSMNEGTSSYTALAFRVSTGSAFVAEACQSSDSYCPSRVFSICMTAFCGWGLHAVSMEPFLHFEVAHKGNFEWLPQGMHDLIVTKQEIFSDGSREHWLHNRECQWNCAHLLIISKLCVYLCICTSLIIWAGTCSLFTATALS